MTDDYAEIISNHRVTVAESQGTIVGVIVLTVTDEGFLIDNVAVHPSYRGKGLGKALLEFAEAEAQRAGFDSIYLYTHEKMTENQSLYSRIGYVEYDRRSQGDFSLVYMRKQLRNDGELRRTSVTEPAKVHFDSNGVMCVGYLYPPTNLSAPSPCVVLATGFTGTQDTPSIRAAAQEFAAAGFTALTFDYRNFGESDGAPRQLIRIQGQQEDLHAAIRFARSQTGVDPERIALWGTSLGGGHVVAVAADDPKIAAVVAQIPFNGFPKEVEGRSTAATLRLLGAMVRDAIRGRLGRPPYYIRAVGTTGELAVMATPQAQQTIDAMQSNQWRNEVAPRVLFEMMRYKPGDMAHQLSMPVLVSIAENDRETPPDLVRQIAENAPRGEYKSYPVAHFEFYRPDVRALVLRDQVSFLRKHLLVGS